MVPSLLLTKIVAMVSFDGRVFVDIMFLLQCNTRNSRIKDIFNLMKVSATIFAILPLMVKSQICGAILVYSTSGVIPTLVGNANLSTNSTPNWMDIEPKAYGTEGLVFLGSSIQVLSSLRLFFPGQEGLNSKISLWRCSQLLSCSSYIVAVLLPAKDSVGSSVHVIELFTNIVEEAGKLTLERIQNDFRSLCVMRFFLYLLIGINICITMVLIFAMCIIPTF